MSANQKGRKPTGGHGAVRAIEKPNNFFKTWGKLLIYCKRYIWFFAVATLLAIATSVFTIIGPDLLGDVTNLIQEGIMGQMNYDGIWKICIILIIFYSAAALFSYAQSFIMATMAQRLSQRMRKDISEKINRMPFKYFDSTPFGDVLSRVTNDVDTIGMALNLSVVTIITSVTLLIGVCIMMFITSPILATVAIVSSILGFVVNIIIMVKSQKHFVAQQKSLGELDGHIEEVYAGHNVVKAFNGEEQAKQVFNKHNAKLYSSAWKSQFMSGLMMPIMNFIGNFGYVAVCAVGGTLVAEGKIKIGVIISFMMYIKLFTQPLAQIAQSATSLQSAAAAGERVFDFLSEKELSDESHKNVAMPAIKGDVEFKNVCFGYNEDRIIIHDFSAKIKAGQKIAIVGPTGAGKTTLVNLLMRFYELNSGQILIDGVPIDTLTRTQIHDIFGMVLQDTWLFEGTIKDNIIYGKENISDEKLTEVCKAASIDHFIRTLPKGYNTVLNDKTSLSAGQKQLMTIARAMIENAPMLILDEATSSVDTRTEVLIQEAMDKLTVGRTSFVIAHRLSTIKNADLILVMKDGDIIEKGTHEQLLEQKSFYCDLYNSQFATE